MCAMTTHIRTNVLVTVMSLGEFSRKLAPFFHNKMHFSVRKIDFNKGHTFPNGDFIICNVTDHKRIEALRKMIDRLCNCYAQDHTYECYNSV